MAKLTDQKLTVQEIDELIGNLKEDKKQVEKRKVFLDGASEIRMMYQSLIDVGFDEEQAYEILKISLEKGVK